MEAGGNRVLKVISMFKERFTARQRAVLCVLFMLLLLCVTAAVARVASNKASLSLAIEKGSTYEKTALIALDSMAKNKSIKGSASYKFTKEQLDRVSSYVLQHKDGALSVVVALDEKADGGERGEFSLEFLSDEASTIVKCDMKACPNVRLTLSFGKDKMGQVIIPKGFRVNSNLYVRIEEASISRAAIGYDKTYRVPHYAFSATGGNAPIEGDAVDFSGGSVLFPTQNALMKKDGSLQSLMPKIIVKLEEREGEEKGELNFGGERFTLYRYKGVNALTVYAAALKMPFNIVKAEGVKVSALMMVSSEEDFEGDARESRVLEPYKTDPGFIISWPEGTWRTRDYEIFEWDRFPKVLFIDFRNYEVQSAFLRRLAFFTEKKGYRGRLASDEELKGKHDYNAHDYKDESMASFFTLARKEDFPLNDSEILLKDILLHNGVIKEEDEGYAPSGGALISISKQSEMWLRERLLSHEGWHGIYFTDERFRNAVAAVYGTMDARSRDFIEGFWGTQEGLGYDTNDPYLTQNEFMAYLMQQSVKDTASYFVHLAGRGSVMRGIPDLCRYVLDTGGQTFEDAASVLDAYAKDNFGLSCGRISLVR